MFSRINIIWHLRRFIERWQLIFPFTIPLTCCPVVGMFATTNPLSKLPEQKSKTQPNLSLIFSIKFCFSRGEGYLRAKKTVEWRAVKTISKGDRQQEKYETNVQPLIHYFISNRKGTKCSYPLKQLYGNREYKVSEIPFPPLACLYCLSIPD